MLHRGRVRAGAWLWVGCFQFFLAEQIVRLQVRGTYSMARNYISDLGATRCFTATERTLACSPLHWLMNGSFVLQGGLILLGAAVLSSLDRSRIWRMAACLFSLSGAGLLLVGLVPEDVATGLHLAGAAVHFVSGACAMLVASLALWPRGARAGALSLLTGSCSLVATLLLGFGGTASYFAQHALTGLVERLAAYPLPLWLVCAGITLLFHPNGNLAGARR